MQQTTAPRLDRREQHCRIAGPRVGLRLFLRGLSPAQSTGSCCARPGLPVLYVHGATFPSGLSVATGSMAARGAMHVPALP